jgi:hypothetical protein
VLVRPKVFHNAKAGQFVMYMHIDGRLPGNKSRYSIASIGIATCDRVDGNYRYQRHVRPLGLESRDIGQYEGLYYALGSALTGWWPNANKYATARRLEGPWTIDVATGVVQRPV